MLNFKCLIIDHDDTVVRSTKEIHYPAFLETLQLLRPGMKISLEEFISYNFSLGFLGLCQEILRLDENEMQIEYDIWKKHTRKTIPQPFNGIKEILTRFQKENGIIAVSSHSESYEITRDFQRNFSFLPAEIYGWDLEVEKRKPGVFCVEDLKEKYNLKNDDMIMLDDGMPGYLMCQKAQVKFIGNCYYDSTAEVKNFMYKNADFTIDEVSDLSKILFY